jgi:hypothetical protein
MAASAQTPDRDRERRGPTPVHLALPTEVAEWFTEQARRRFKSRGGYIRDLLVGMYTKAHDDRG